MGISRVTPIYCQNTAILGNESQIAWNKQVNLNQSQALADQSQAILANSANIDELEESLESTNDRISALGSMVFKERIKLGNHEL